MSTPRNSPFRSGRRLGLLLCLAAVTLVAVGAVAQESGQEQAAGQEAPQETPEPTPPPPGTPEPPRFLSGLQTTLEDYTGDLFYWGQGASITGTLGDNVFAGGQLISVDGGTVGGDLFAFGASVTIDGEVMGDVYAFGSDVRVSPGSVIHGNLTAFTGTLRIGGTVRGHVRGGGGGTIITGDIGPVDIEAGSLTISETAIIRGDLVYQSNEEASIAEGADIQGNVRRSRDQDDDEDDEADEEPDEGGFSLWSIGWTLWRYLSALVVGTVLLLVGGRVTRQPADSLRTGAASGLGFGFVVAVVFPIACLVAMVLLVTLPLGVMGLVVFALLLYAARLVCAQFLGAWVLTRITGNQQPSEYLSLALGLVLLMSVGMIPYLGFLLRMIALVLGLGGIYLALRHFGFPSSGGRRPATRHAESEPQAG